MKRLTWWFRIVGLFYLLLAALGGYSVFGNPAMLSETFPFSVDANGIRAAGDLWLIFTLEIMVLGAFLVWASREPLKHRNLVWLIIWLELIRGALDDLYLITQGYDAASYAVFIAIHMLIIATGILFVRQANATKPATSAAMTA